MSNSPRVALFLCLLSSAAYGFDAGRVQEWQGHYYIDAHSDQEYLNAVASFIANILHQRPSEEIFEKELQQAVGSLSSCPPYFKSCLSKLFKNAYIVTYKGSLPLAFNQTLWQKNLLEYYAPLYGLLDNDHKTIRYGPRKDVLLPIPTDKNSGN